MSPLSDVVVHPSALCEGASLGPGTRIGPFVHVAADAKIGAACVVHERVSVAAGARLGDRVVVQPGAYVAPGVELSDDVQIGPNVVFTGPSLQRADGPSQLTVVRRGAIIGAGATVAAGLSIGAGAIVEAGAVVNGNVPPNAVVRGNPAQIAGYVDAAGAPSARAASGAPAATPAGTPTRVAGVTLHRFPVVEDMRGNLSVGEFESQVPFAPKRWFLVYGVPGSNVRGEHAHKVCKQFLICVRGGLSVVSDDGETRDETRLDAPHLGLYLPPMIWGTQYLYTDDAVLLVFASERYDANDYIRDYDAFQRAIAERNRA